MSYQFGAPPRGFCFVKRTSCEGRVCIHGGCRERRANRHARVGVRGRLLSAGARERRRPAGRGQLLAQPRARRGVREDVVDSRADDEAGSADRARRHRSVYHRAAERRASAGLAEAVEGEASSGLHQAARAHARGGKDDADGREAIGRDARLRRDGSVRAVRGQGAGSDRVRRRRPRVVGAIARVARRPAQQALLGRDARPAAARCTISAVTAFPRRAISSAKTTRSSR